MSLKNQAINVPFLEVDEIFVLKESGINKKAVPESVVKQKEVIRKKMLFVESKEKPAKIKSRFPPKDFNQKQFLNRVKEEMQFIGITQEELAPMCYINSTRMSHIMNNRFPISEAEHKEMCRIFGID